MGVFSCADNKSYGFWSERQYSWREMCMPKHFPVIFICLAIQFRRKTVIKLSASTKGTTCWWTNSCSLAMQEMESLPSYTLLQRRKEKKLLLWHGILIRLSTSAKGGRRCRRGRFLFCGNIRDGRCVYL